MSLINISYIIELLLVFGILFVFKMEVVLFLGFFLIFVGFIGVFVIDGFVGLFGFIISFLFWVIVILIVSEVDRLLEFVIVYVIW